MVVREIRRRLVQQAPHTLARQPLYQLVHDRFILVLLRPTGTFWTRKWLKLMIFAPIPETALEISPEPQSEYRESLVSNSLPP